MTEKTKLTHAALETLEYEDGVLLWGGRKLTAISEEIGRTPFYAYDRARMNKRVADIRTVMPDELRIHYAMKANPMPGVVEHMVGLVDGLDVASEGELRVALETGIDPRNVSFAGPGKRHEELRAGIESGITINMESMVEMRRISVLANDIGCRPNVAVRINPAFELKSAGMKMGGHPSQFGVDSEQVPEMLEELKTLDLCFRGFHVYSGSQNLRFDAIAESITKTVDLILDLAERTACDISTVNIGGGLGIPYFPNERSLDVAALEAPVASAIQRLQSALGKIEVIMELGRYLVGEAGIYVVRVVDIKESRGTTFAICDGGLHHHLAASGNFGQVIRKNYPITSAFKNSQTTEEYTVVGPLCTPLDLLGKKIQLSELEIGSLVVIMQSGAYGATASPHQFLSQPSCTENLM